MSALEHRLQVLINDELKAALERESRATGRSVGAVVREAIEVHYATETRVKTAALEWILAHGSKSDEEWMEWDEIKEGLLADLDERVPTQ